MALGMAFVGMISVGALFSGCEKKKEVLAKPVRPVTVAQAVTRTIPLYRKEIGNCVAYEEVIIQPQVNGMLIGVHFEDGAEIRKGDTLFSIDPRPYKAALDQAKATLATDQAKAAYAQLQVKRNEELSKTKIIAAQEYDSLCSTADAAKATVEADRALVDQAALNLEYCEIRSPIDGRASKKKVDKGNLVTANSTQLLSIQRQDPIYVDFIIPEKALSDVRRYHEKGTLKVEISSPDEPGKCRVGQFRFLDNAIKPNTGTITLRALLENKDRLFWPGQYVNVRLLLDEISNAVLVPSDALQVGQVGPFVFVVKPDNTVELRPVAPGQRQGAEVAISKGLQAGETVVVTGQLALAPGASVRIVEPLGKVGKDGKEIKTNP